MFDLMKMAFGLVHVCYFFYGTCHGMGPAGFALGMGVLYLLVFLVPFCRKQESTWIFFLCLIGTFPLNAELVRLVVIFYRDYSAVARGFVAVTVYMCLLAGEELLLGIIGRVLWKNQEESFCNLRPARRKTNTDWEE